MRGDDVDLDDASVNFCLETARGVEGILFLDLLGGFMKNCFILEKNFLDITATRARITLEK